MSLAYNKQSPYIQELAKWEIRPVEIDGVFINPNKPPYDPAEHPYPRMLVRFERATVGPPILKYRTVQNESEQLLEQGQGWHLDQQAALDALAAEQTEVATMAANRDFHDRRMTQQAQAEAQAAIEKSAVHLGEIPRKAVRKYVKKVKAH